METQKVIEDDLITYVPNVNAQLDLLLKCLVLELLLLKCGGGAMNESIKFLLIRRTVAYLTFNIFAVRLDPSEFF